MSKTVDFILSSPLKYSVDGDFKEESAISMSAPHFGTALVKKNARVLKQLAMKALMEAGKAAKGLDTGEQKDEKKESEPGALFQAFFMSDVDVNPIIDAMKALAPAVITIGNGHKFKEANWDSMSMDDQESVTGIYIESFLMR